jgi:hypothetical protein
MMNLYQPILMRDGYHDCQVSGNDEPCEQQAVWWCYPQGFLTTKIAMCDHHKRKAEQQEQARMVIGLVMDWNDDEDPINVLDGQSSRDHEEV